MRKKATLVVAVMFAAALAVPAVLARSAGRPEGGARFEKMAEKLDLNEEQVVQLRAIEFKYQQDQIDRRAAQAKAQLSLREQMVADTPDIAACTALINQLADLSGEGIKARWQKSLAVRGILTAEQWEQYQRASHFRRGRDGSDGQRGRQGAGFRHGGPQGARPGGGEDAPGQE